MEDKELPIPNLNFPSEALPNSIEINPSHSSSLPPIDISLQPLQVYSRRNNDTTRQVQESEHVPRIESNGRKVTD